MSGLTVQFAQWRIKNTVFNNWRRNEGEREIRKTIVWVRSKKKQIKEEKTGNRREKRRPAKKDFFFFCCTFLLFGLDVGPQG